MRARITPTLVIPGMLIVALAVLSCSKDDDAGNRNNVVGNEINQAGDHAAQAGVTSAAPAAKAPYDGALSPQRMERAKAQVQPFMTWDQTYPMLLATVGKPTLVEEGKHYWHVQEGDKCHELYVENAGGEVGMVSFGAYDKIMKTQWQRCSRATGAGAGTGDDVQAEQGAGGGEQGAGEQGTGEQGAGEQGAGEQGAGEQGE